MTDNKMRGELTDKVLDFVVAGRAIFTIENVETGGRFTFKVDKPREDTPHFVRVLTGPDNGSDYSYLGTIFGGQTWRHGAKSRISATAPSAKAFAWFWGRLQNGGLPPQVKVYHEGRCGRCGRRLTVPESIVSGFGPVCAGRE